MVGSALRSLATPLIASAAATPLQVRLIDQSTYKAKIIGGKYWGEGVGCQSSEAAVASTSRVREIMAQCVVNPA